MKIFMDTADVNEIKQAVDMGMVDGVTTNPSLLAKAGRPTVKVIEEICGLVNGPISVEAVSTHAKGMMEEARSFAKIHDNITIKLPMTAEGLKAVKACAADGIKTNVTLIFQALQGLLAAKAGATFVSPFIGRLDDIATDGMSMVEDLMTMLQNYGYKTEVIVASVRHPIHVMQAALIGADIVTLPYKVFESLVKHPLTDAGIQKFLEDHSKIPRG